MKALIIRGTTHGGKILNAGEVHELPHGSFMVLKRQGQAIEAQAEQPEPAPAQEETAVEPVKQAKQFKRKT